MQDGQTTNEQLKIELLSQWKLVAESRNYLRCSYFNVGQSQVPDDLVPIQFPYKLHNKKKP